MSNVGAPGTSFKFVPKTTLPAPFPRGANELSSLPLESPAVSAVAVARLPAVCRGGGGSGLLLCRAIRSCVLCAFYCLFSPVECLLGVANSGHCMHVGKLQYVGVS